MSFLALQFGVQPILVRKYTPQTIVRSSVVLVQELVKFGIAGTIYFSGTKKETREKDFEGWSIKTWIALAGLPAFLYTIQNLAALMAYQNLEALTFNVLNQTKILSAALSCYFVMGKRQSTMQVISLCVLILSTLVIEQILHPGAVVSLMSMRGGAAAFGLQNPLKGMSGAFSSLSSYASGAGRRVTHGIVPIFVASLISGLAGALTQKNLQGSQGSASIWAKKRSTKSSPLVTRPPRNAYLFSMEMNIASVILLLVSLGLSSDGRTILRSRSFFSNWTPETFIPVITNSIGGILVGLVTKHAGSVRKGFALIFGLLLSGIFQAGGAGIRTHQIAGGLLAAVSLWMHTAHPYKPAPAAKGD
jgi:UDP-sugar transporter A1/2/3